MKISFCTTCMGRAHHLKETLTANLADNAGYADLEFLILDYNSKDDLESWMRGQMAGVVGSGRVSYYRERTSKFFNPRHAKNVAHLLAKGEVLVNLDADNFTGPGYAEKLAQMFSEPGKFFVTTTFTNNSLSGKIAIRASDFRAVRAYDEALVEWSGEDPDLKRRARRFFSLRQIDLVWPGERAIEHSDEERTKNFECRLPIRATTNANYRVFMNRRPTDVINPAGFGKAVVYNGFGDEPVTTGAGPA